MTDQRAHDILGTLYNLRGLTDSELVGLLEDAATGDPEAVEWAMARMDDLDRAHEEIEALLRGAMDRSDYVSISDATAELGVTPSALYRRLKRLGMETVEAPRAGLGPRTGRYMRRDDLARLRATPGNR